MADTYPKVRAAREDLQAEKEAFGFSDRGPEAMARFQAAREALSQARAAASAEHRESVRRHLRRVSVLAALRHEKRPDLVQTLRVELEALDGVGSLVEDVPQGDAKGK